MSLVLLGGGGHASDVLVVVEALVAAGSVYEPLYVADDAWRQPERFEGRAELKMIESIEAGARLAPFLVSIGYPGGRRVVHDRAVAVGGKPSEAVVHPFASVGLGVELGLGAVVMGQTWLSAKVCGGDHTHIGYGVSIGHDTCLGDFCSVMPGASLGGDITVGDGVMVGANAVVLEGRTIGDGACVGAGAVVTKDVAADTTVIGVPARKQY